MVRPIRSLQNLILEGDPFGIVFLELCFRGVRICEDLEVVAVSNLLARIHVDQHGHFEPWIFDLASVGSSSASLSAHRSLRFSFAVRL